MGGHQRKNPQRPDFAPRRSPGGRSPGCFVLSRNLVSCPVVVSSGSQSGGRQRSLTLPLVRLHTKHRTSVTRSRIGLALMFLSTVVFRAHALQLLRPRLAPAAVWMAAEVEPLCDGCPFRCDGCPWDWMDEDVEPQLLLLRDRQARQELGLDEEDFVEYVTERFGAAVISSVESMSGTESQEVGFSDNEPG